MILFLLSYPNWTTDKLAEKLNRKKRYTKELLKELKSDISYFLDDDLDIEISLNGEITVNKKCSEALLRLFYSLKLAYLKETNEFKLFHFFLENPTCSINSISDQLFLSLSYTRRIIKKINSYLKPFDFKINEDKGNCSLIGNELSICLFFYVLMNDTYHSLPWPYTTKDLPQHINFRQSLHIMLTIINSRKNSNATVPKLKPKSSWIISQMKETYNFIPDFKLKNTYYEDSLNETEIEDYFIFFTHIYSPHLIPKDIKVSLGKQFLYAPEHLSLFSRNLSFKIINEFQLDYHEEKQYLLIYYLTMLDCFYEIMKKTTILFEDIIFIPLQYSLTFEKNQIKKIELFLKNILIEESRSDIVRNNKLQQYFSGLIYTILQVEKPPIIHIYLHLTKSFTANELVQTRLESIYNSKTVIFTPCFEQADLIITDSLNFDTESKKDLVYFNTILKHDQWELLLQRINQLLFKKITTHERAFN